MKRGLIYLAFLLPLLPHALVSQVHYFENGRPWNQKAGSGPDAEVNGWFYNLGITGMRAELIAKEPNFLLIQHVFDGSPAAGKVKVGDLVVGANGRAFETPHRNGYGMKVFGPDGPLLDFAMALEESQSKDRKGRLDLDLKREDKTIKLTLNVGTQYGTYSPKYPAECAKSTRI
ncbi:MAG: hypothetical protein CMO46_08480, partial [Verrucomicrobiales bacterium]|nr:hypothetical protein [Verrucomicrobiales bacterium]